MADNPNPDRARRGATQAPLAFPLVARAGSAAPATVTDVAVAEAPAAVSPMVAEAPAAAGTTVQTKSNCPW